MRVFLADLRYDSASATDTVPLGIAELATYADAYAPLDEPLDVRLFRDPTQLAAAIDEAPPDLLGLSSFAWNHRLARVLARRARARDGGVLTVLGGPNRPDGGPALEIFLRSMPEIDVLCGGPRGEGERAFLNLVRRFETVGCRREGIFEEPLAGSDWIDPRSDTLVRGGVVAPVQDLDEIPSPYTSHWLDAFVARGAAPVVQIARGCAFEATCGTFEDDVGAHSLANVRADLDYMAAHARRDVPLVVADERFGINPLDEEVADYIAHLHARTGWPRTITIATGGHSAAHLAQVARKDPHGDAASAIVRDDARTLIETRETVILELHSCTAPEIVVGRPWESKGDLLRRIASAMAQSSTPPRVRDLVLRFGDPDAAVGSRARAGLRTRFTPSVAPGSCGTLESGRAICEIDEIVVSTATLSEADADEVHSFQLLSAIYLGGGFEEAVAFARSLRMEPFDLVSALHARLDRAPEGISRLVESFLRETHDTRFETPEECCAWIERELAARGAAGDVAQHHAILGRYFALDQTLRFLEDVLRSCVRERGGAADDEVAGLVGYLRAVLLHAPFTRTTTLAPPWTSVVDVERWRNEGYQRPLDAYRFARPVTLGTAIDPAARARLLAAVAEHGERAASIARFATALDPGDLRRRIVSGVRQHGYAAASA
jgi:hypothetical protein